MKTEPTDQIAMEVAMPITIPVPEAIAPGGAVVTSVPVPTALDYKGNIVQDVKQPGFPRWMVYTGIALAAVAVIYTVTRKKEPQA